MIKANLGAAMQGLAVIPIFAGYDLIRRTGRLWDFDITGGRYEEREFVATGSGMGPAATVLKVGYRSGQSATEAVELACRALWEAAEVDAATGGPDALRGIYPVVATISADGWRAVDDTELASVFERLAAAQRAGRGAAS